MSKFNALVTKLREVFQIDRPDLDFGIYRIMNARAEQITRYLEHDLREKVTASLGSLEKSDTADRLHKLRKGLEDFFTPSAFAADGTLTDQAALSTDKGKEYQSLHSKFLIQNSKLDAGPEDQVFSHLTTFFSRYYEKGDYISQRRYKGDTYAIPYSGEEVVLHWANKDQYYIKSGESFTNYSFKLDDGRRVSFQLLSADTAKDNRKDNDENRLFALIPEGYSLTKTDDDGEEIITAYDPITESENGDLIIHFTYQGYPKSVKKKDKNTASLQSILAHSLVTDKWRDLHSRKPTEKNKERTLLEYHLTTYTEKNTADYFIHKDLGTFLRNELDFYIKNEVMHLDDVQNAETFDAIKDNLRLIQTLREIALDLIRFLAQLEDFQRKLWLKKKFVTQTDYCLTLDRIPEKLYPEIAASDPQREEWLHLFSIDEIEAEEGDLAKEDTVGYSNPLTIPFLKQNLNLVLDTTHFDEEFKAQLLDAIPNLDESLDGLVIHSENFQALSLLQERYREKVQCVYIDPPYNTGSDGFLYRDSLKHSSWLTLIGASLKKARDLMSKSSSFTMSLDEGECERARTLLKQTFGEENFITSAIWQKKYAPANDAKWFSEDHDYLFVAAKDREQWYPEGLQRDEKQNNAYKNPDHDERGVWKAGDYTCNKNRHERPRSWYPVIQPTTKEEIWPSEDAVWRYSKELHAKNVAEDRIWWGKKKENKVPAFKRFLSDVGNLRPRTIWKHEEVGHNQDGMRENKELFGFKTFASPKPIRLLKRVLELNQPETTLDYFAGSGTTGHAVINLNREDNGKRKYILVEMGDHFDTVLRPRLKKVAYSADWKDGKPTSRTTGISHGFKYLRLESYEDVLNNLRLPESESDLLSSAMGQDYQLGYMLDVEARASLLSVADFKKPFDYQLNIATDSSGASEPRPIDLVETFNYLIGLTVEHYDRNLARGYAKVTGTLPTGEKTLILWRDCEMIGYEELDELCKKWDISPRQKEYDLVYLNGDHNLPNVLQELEKDGGSTQELRLRQIEPEFLKLMFEEN